ncbi:MAG TPA: hypothetical protein VJJ52_04205 [Candidatus Nanoarchaeia archaeon]|nr:hypothetical protein [Candidatus Nanoarchaeia archaeon]
MRLEDALKLTKGTTLLATDSWIGPEQVTKGKTYVMQADTRQVWPGIDFFNLLSYSKLRDNDKPVNAHLPIMDDRGKLMYATHIHFEVVQ